MKSLRHAFLVAAGLTAFVSATPAPAALTITEVMSSSALAGAGGTPDWFEITNTGAASIPIAGLQMDDNSFSFAASVPLLGVTSLPAGASAVFIESSTPATDIPAFRAYWAGSATNALIGSYSGSGVGLGAGGDGVEIFDGTTQANLAQVSFGTAVTGSSFDNRSGANGTITTISLVGVNGAFASVGTPTNIGSPGVVPEPSPVALLALAGAVAGVVLIRRQRQIA